MPISATNPFKWRHFPGEVILLCVRWYLRYPLAYEHVSEILAERGVEVDASCIWRWVQAYAPELNNLYRAVDSRGQTIDFLLTAKRDAAAAKRFLRKAMAACVNFFPPRLNLSCSP